MSGISTTEHSRRGLMTEVGLRMRTVLARPDFPLWRLDLAPFLDEVLERLYRCVQIGRRSLCANALTLLRHPAQTVLPKRSSQTNGSGVGLGLEMIVALVPCRTWHRKLMLPASNGRFQRSARRLPNASYTERVSHHICSTGTRGHRPLWTGLSACLDQA